MVPFAETALQKVALVREPKPRPGLGLAVAQLSLEAVLCGRVKNQSDTLVENLKKRLLERVDRNQRRLESAGRNGAKGLDGFLLVVYSLHVSVVVLCVQLSFAD